MTSSAATAPRIGLEIGYTHFDATALDESGTERARARVATPPSYDEAVAALAGLVEQLEAAAGAARHVGASLPGSISPRTSLMRNVGLGYLNGRMLGRDLARRIGKEVVLANNANCLAVSEAADGAAAGAAVVFAVILGGGCGGGLAIDGKVVAGGNGIAGEWGHNPLPWAGPGDAHDRTCWCGKRDCIELWLAEFGLRAAYAACGGGDLAATEILARGRTGDPAAAQVVREWLDRLARGLAAIVNLVDPEVIVFGGDLAGASEIYGQVPPLMKRYIFSDQWFARLRPAKWGASSAVRGAARL